MVECPVIRPVLIPIRISSRLRYRNCHPGYAPMGSVVSHKRTICSTNRKSNSYAYISAKINRDSDHNRKMFLTKRKSSEKFWALQTKSSARQNIFVQSRYHHISFLFYSLKLVHYSYFLCKGHQVS